MSYKGDLKKLAEAMGFQIIPSKGRRIHILLVHRISGRKVFAPSTPRNPWRTLRNVRGEMRRASR